MNFCILISTCDKHADLAVLTIDLIHKRWKDHPSIFVCGVSRPIPGAVETLPLKNDEWDWVGIAESAAGALMEKGYQQCYLILEDHPPLQPCNETHLNSTLPALMEKLDAAYIGLYGWGQNTRSAGKPLSAEFYRLQHQEETFLWQYSLHPALWRLNALKAVLNALPIIEGDAASRSAWAFERRSGSVQSQIPAEWRGRAYRVYGLGMLGGRFRFVRRAARRMLFMAVNLTVLIAGKLMGSAARDRLLNFVLSETLFFDGPYPMYWSGVMQKGSLNKNFEKFLLLRRRNRELSNFRAVIRKDV